MTAPPRPGRVRLGRGGGVLILGAVAALAGCDGGASPSPGDAVVAVAVPPGWAPVPVPAGQLLTAARVALGRDLFHDPILSQSRTLSCASCHRADLAFTDGVARSAGRHGTTGLRNAPTLLNVAYRPAYFWDGGAPSLEGQSVAPLEAEHEMDTRLDTVLARLGADRAYRRRFADAFGAEGVSVRTFTQALAAFQRTLVSRTTPYDLARTGDSAALGDAARRGLRLFAGRAACAACHAGPMLTDDAYRDAGLARVATGADADSGRARITLRPADAYRFRTPTLRAVARTAPYFHDGRAATLDAAVETAGPHGHGAGDARLTAAERADLVAFLRTLTD